MQLTRKQWIGAVIGVVVVAVLAYGGWLLVKTLQDPYKGLRTHVDVQMTDEIRDLVTHRVATTQASIEAQEGTEDGVDPDLYILLANDESLLGDLVPAREAAQKAVDANPLNFAALNLLGSIEEEMYDYEAARDAYKLAIDQHPGIEEFYRDYVTLLEAHWPEERDEIRAVVEQSIADNARTVWNMTELARWYNEEGDCDQALAHYKIAVGLDPTNTDLAGEEAGVKAECKAKK